MCYICLKSISSKAAQASSMVLYGGLSGGVSSHLAGGSFGQGFSQGIITAGLNHALHGMADAMMASKMFYRAEIGIKDSNGNPIGTQYVVLEFSMNGKGEATYTGYSDAGNSTCANLEMSVASVITTETESTLGFNINVQLKAAQFNYGSAGLENGITVYGVYTGNDTQSTNQYIGGGNAIVNAFITFEKQPFLLNSQSVSSLDANKGFAIAANTKTVYVKQLMNPYINSTIFWQNGNRTPINGNFRRNR